MIRPFGFSLACKGSTRHNRSILVFTIGIASLFSPLSVFASHASLEYYKQGLNYALEGKFDDAREQLKTALRMDKGDRLAEEAIQLFEEYDKGKINKEYMLFQFQGARDMFDSAYARALSAFKAALDIMPESAMANNNVGVGYLYTGSHHEAVEYFIKALQLDKNYLDAHTNLAFCYNNYVIEPQKAKEYALQALKINPASSGACAELGRAYQLLGSCDQAIKYYKKALRLEPDDVLACHGLAQCLFVSGDKKGAIRYYQKILTVTPGYCDAYFGLADVYLSLNDLEGAESALCKAKDLAVKSDDPDRLGLAEERLEALRKEQEKYQWEN